MIPLHPRDQEYFDAHPAPIMKMLQEYHFTLCNSTIPFFGPMLYFFVRQIGAEQILEIGTAEGYTSFYLANGLKDNAIRYGMYGNKFYGLDICQVEKTQQSLLSYDLPVVIENKDSLTLTSDYLPGVVFDIIFQDGNHDEAHVIYEFSTLWGRLKDKGNGFWIAHDCYGPAEKGCNKLIQYIKQNNIDVEYLRIPGMYGLLIIRKMENYDYDKRFWVD